MNGITRSFVPRFRFTRFLFRRLRLAVAASSTWLQRALFSFVAV